PLGFTVLPLIPANAPHGAKGKAPGVQEAWRSADAVLFTRKIRFIRPDGTQGVTPSNETALWGRGARANGALQRAAHEGLGVLARPVRLIDRRVPA
ncbi:MAG: hypothetical protein ACK5X3_16020, partial [Pseudomonadota bacterium]